MIASVLLATGIAVLFVAIIAREVRNAKKGKSTCSCGCGGCAMRNMCHRENDTSKSR